MNFRLHCSVLSYHCTVAIGQDESNNATTSSTGSQPCLPPQTRSLAPVGSPPSLTQTPITKLQEYCQQNNIVPLYKELQVTAGFRYTVTVRDRQYSGEIKNSKQDAKHSAAEVALQRIDNSSKFKCTHHNIVCFLYRFGQSWCKLCFSCERTKGKVF